MKMYLIYRRLAPNEYAKKVAKSIYDNNNIDTHVPKKELYGWTNRRKIAETFMSVHKESMFILKCKDMDDEDFEALVIPESSKTKMLDYHTLRDKTRYVTIASNDDEMSTIDDSFWDDIVCRFPEVIKNLCDCRLFAKKYHSALDILSIAPNRVLGNPDDYGEENIDVFEESYSSGVGALGYTSSAMLVNSLNLYCKVFADYLKSGDKK